jgi:hypothetical protein
MKEWRFVVPYTYGTLTLADAGHDPGATGAPFVDPVAMTRAWEDRCQSLGSAILVQLIEGAGYIPVEVRLLTEGGPTDSTWDHIAELSLSAPSGRVQVYGWIVDSDLAGEIDVPSEQLRARIHWGGLEDSLRRELAPDGAVVDPTFVRVDLFPGRHAPVQTLRTWHLWAPPVHEATTEGGLRRYRGYRAREVQTTLEPLKTRFWSPYPTVEEGHVTSMWRAPADGSIWALGSSQTGHPFLQELTAAEAERLQSEGFPQVRTYATDGDGRIWTSDQVPFERTDVLNLIPADRWPLLRSFLPDDEILIIDLPPGWTRVTARPRDGGPPRLVPGVEGNGNDAFYQRWRDGAEIPER